MVVVILEIGLIVMAGVVVVRLGYFVLDVFCNNVVGIIGEIFWWMFECMLYVVG